MALEVRHQLNICCCEVSKSPHSTVNPLHAAKKLWGGGSLSREAFLAAVDEFVDKALASHRSVCPQTSHLMI